MAKHKITDLFIYKHRFGIGYILLALIFIGLLFFLPTISPAGLSQAEMESSVISASVNASSIFSGNIIDLPYHLLQKLSIKIFGLTAYSIKLPSIIIGLSLCILLIFLLNRWFKNNVALIASILSVLSTPFLYLVGSGTPLIMIVFWPTFLLWLGSKIQGVKAPRISYCFIFIAALLLTIFTPYMIYIAGFIFIYVMAHPHLRFTVKNLPRIPLVIACSLGTAVGFFLLINILNRQGTATELLFVQDFSIGGYLNNIKNAFLPYFSWTGGIEGTLLSPMIGLASLALAFTGLISTAKGFFASRNSIASLLIIFTVFISGFNPDAAILIILPFAILTAHGIRYILNMWYGLFPENPYARIFAIFPIGLFIGIMIISSTFHFIFGYRYNPAVANEFNNDLELIYEKVEPGTTILVAGGTLEYDFYNILTSKTDYKIASSTDEIEDGAIVATLRKWEMPENLQLNRIITSPKSINSDRIYLYK